MSVEQAAQAFSFNAPLVSPERLRRKDIKRGDLRISCDCVAKRVIQAIDPIGSEDRYWPIDVGVGQRGDDIADLWDRRRLKGVTKRHAEVCIPWAFDHCEGVAHIDRFVESTKLEAGFDYDGVWEIKSKLSGNKPAPEDVRQVKRYMRLVELSNGFALTHDACNEVCVKGPFRIVVINPSTLAVYGPWTIELDDDDRGWIDDEFAIMDRLWERRESLDIWHDEQLKAACNCGECFPVVGGEAEGTEREILQALAPLMKTSADTKVAIDELRADLLVSMRPGSKIYTDLLSASCTGTLEKPKLTLRQKAANARPDDE
jgi:hypothetical protein